MSEKWFDRLHITAPTSERQTDIARQFEASPALAEIHGVQELEKNELEQQAVQEALAALNTLLADLNLPQVAISPDRIHVLTEDEFDTKIEEGEEMGGKATYGHAYLVRTDERVRFIHNLTHELAHLVSYLALTIEELKEADGSTLNYIGLKRSGFSFLKRKPAPEERMYFEGLNEGTTELFAHILRQMLIPNTQLLDKTEKERLADVVVYEPQIQLIEKLIEVIGETEEGRREAMRELLCNFVTGDYSFLKKLEAEKKGAVKILLRIGDTKEDAIRAAETFGFDDVAARIRAHSS